MRRCTRCGHMDEAHEHHRRGSDCSLCTCTFFTTTPHTTRMDLWRAWWALVLTVAHGVKAGVRHG